MENMYKVGDYVYFETSSTSPFQIRRIEELNKTPNGHVEAKVMCFYRRRDISSSLIMLADKHQSLLEENGETVPEEKEEEQSEKGSHQLKHRELFLSRQVETLPATHIRGKCVVTLLNETEALTSYLNKEDMFFYSLVYDPQQKTLLADKGEIRVGSKYQAEITSLLEGEDTRKLSELEDLIWQPCPENGITDKEIDQFQIVAKSVGTFARALDCTSTVRQPSLHMSAAAASRDISLFNAMHTLHEYKYNIANAVTSLVPDGGPVLCKDEMEEWSASEANLFEEALDKYGKDFNDIRQDFLPWKSLKSIIEYYYMWKTTDRYVQQKRIKAAEAERKLKQVYIPNQKPNPAHPAVLSGKMNGDQMSGRACESCYSSHSNLWYAWGPSHLQCRLCSSCWTYWKKYGGLKMPTRLDGERPAPNQRQGQFTFSDRGNAMNIMRTHRCTIAGCGKEFKLKTHLARHLATAHGLAIRPGSPKPVMKTRTAFCLVTTALTRLSRRLCKDLLRPKHAARLPFIPINIAAIKQECQLRLEERGNYVPNIKYRINLSLEPVLGRLGIDITQEKPHLLGRHGTKGKPNERVNNTSSVNREHPSIMRRRGYEQSNGVDNGPPSKIPRVGGVNLPRVPLRVPVPMRNSVLLGVGMNRRNKVRVAKGTRTPMISWIDDPDDVYFVATDATRKLRRKVSQSDHKRAGRNPWKRLLIKPALKGEKEVVVLE